jgi:hypothetical protein
MKKPQTMFTRGLALAAATTFLLTIGTTCASADTFTFQFLPVNTFSGTAPAGTLSVTFSDGAAGHVNMTITSSLAAGENLDPGKALYLNFDPADDAALGALNFALTANTGFSQATVAQLGADSFKADGEPGQFDILLTYTPSTKAFTTGQSQTYDITDATLGAGLVADDFKFQAETGSNFFAAVHVQNTPAGGEGSAFVAGTLAAVPEPTSIALLGTMVLGLAILRKKSRHTV